MELKLKNAKIGKSGPQYYIRIPVVYIRNGLVDVEDSFAVSIMPQKEFETRKQKEND